MPTSNAGPAGGFSLFPNTTQSSSKPPSRKTTPRPRAETPSSARDEDRGPSLEMTPPRNGRRTPENPDLAPYVIDGTPPSESRPFQATASSPAAPPAVSQPLPLAEAPVRTDTAFSGASTLVRSNSNRSRSSIAKRPLEEGPAHASPAAEAGLRSIFPQYDHSLPFDRQDYYPTQTSPSHIPRTVISRQSHVPQQQTAESRSPVRSPLSAGSAQPRWPRRPHGPPVIPPVSTTEDLREYWKTANGWKASAAEGRTYCMRLVPEKDTPVYHLTSTTQPLYHLKISPTSASAYVTLSRHDPNKPFKERDLSADSRPGGGILAALREAGDKNRTWAEAITTTLEEESRRLPPNDGLVALLYPSAATKMALERPGDMQAIMTAERECARLVWDEDSQNYFLVHPALATPFCVTVERNPAWSRTEYAIEHIDSPQHLARLTRDGTGEGWLEVDTLVAGRIDSFYLLDVAVCALLLVANLDEKNTRVEQFEPPPPSLQPPATAHLRDSLLSRMSGRSSDGGSSKKKKKKTTRGGGKAGHGRLEEFEMDLESQTSSLGKQLEVRNRDKLPSTTRTVIKLISFAFKCVIWALTLAFKALVAVVSGLSKCLTSEKL